MIILTHNNMTLKINKFGAEMKSFTIVNEEFLWNKKEYWNKTSPILFPFIGFLRDGSYMINGRQYNLETKHGFARDYEFDVFEKSDNYVKFKLSHNEETLKKYPFKFNLFIEYILNEKGFDIKYEVENLNNDSMYFQIGAHPAFVIENDFEASSYLEFEKEEISKRFHLNDEGFILEKVPFFETLEDKKNLNILDKYFDNDTLIFDDIKSKYIKLKSTKSNKEIKIIFENFPYLAIWKNKKAPYICIEPWYGVSEFIGVSKDITEKKGIVKLDKNSNFNAKLSLEFVKGK